MSISVLLQWLKTIYIVLEQNLTFLCVTMKDGTLIHVQTLTLLALNVVSMFGLLCLFDDVKRHFRSLLVFLSFSFCHCIVCLFSIYGIFQLLLKYLWFGFMLLNTTFNNISWWSVLLVEETGWPRENPRPLASHWQTLSHNVLHLTLIEIRTYNISGDRHWFAQVVVYPTTIRSRLPKCSK